MVGLVILLAIALALLLAIFTSLLAWEMRHPPRHTAGYALARGLPTDPGELGLTFEEWTLERPGGVTIPVWEIVNRQSSIVNPITIVFVHGWGHSRIDALARMSPPDSPFRNAARIVLFDLRGHGEATGTSRLGDGEVDDLVALLERLGEGRVVLVGHSMGAVVAMLAATTSAQVGGVIAYGPYLDFHRSLCGRLRVAGLPTRPITDLAMLVHRAMGVRPLSLTLDQAQRVKCPLLVIHGTGDAVAPMDDARRIVQAARAGTLIEISGADHQNAHEVDRTRHDEAVREFLMNVRQA